LFETHIEWKIHGIAQLQFWNTILTRFRWAKQDPQSPLVLSILLHWKSLITITFHVSINISDKSVNHRLKSYVTDKITSINSILWVLNPLCVMCTSRHWHRFKWWIPPAILHCSTLNLIYLFFQVLFKKRWNNLVLWNKKIMLWSFLKIWMKLKMFQPGICIHQFVCNSVCNICSMILKHNCRYILNQLISNYACGVHYNLLGYGLELAALN